MSRFASTMVVIAVASLALSGCAGLSTGVKVYPQKVYLFVDQTKNVSKILTLPDLKNSYLVQPWSFLSKHDFTIKIQEGQMTELTSNQDSSAALALLQKIVEVAGDLAKASAAAAGAAGVAVADVDFPSSFGLETGIYELNESGKFSLVSR